VFGLCLCGYSRSAVRFWLNFLFMLVYGVQLGFDVDLVLEVFFIGI